MDNFQQTQIQSELLSYIFAISSDNKQERIIAELCVLETLKDIDETVLGNALEFYKAIKERASSQWAAWMKRLPA